MVAEAEAAAVVAAAARVCHGLRMAVTRICHDSPMAVTNVVTNPHIAPTHRNAEDWKGHAA